MSNLKALCAIVLAVSASASRNLRFGMMYGHDMITFDDVDTCLQVWSDGIVTIGSVYQDGGDYTAAAKTHINDLYAYDVVEDPNSVLFKPTLASEVPFRPTFGGALSYFVADPSEEGYIDEDNGFAIAPYTAVRYEIPGVFIDSDSATAMGEYWFTGLDGNETKVEYTFQYMMNSDPTTDCKLKIVTHHSSLPYTP
ncbi:hypothetical protein CTAYLR_002027 [Chrysophaeum taylorii]|uniref:Uncharacterized protein n=1 Tax=Chrysophaeum taylorii TaxID=2483200 RepID=A0AAD7UML2_9STRA|nr:hypothetical protein CTAYLR_002027 [Chrysophaeum taylorii]